MYICWLSSCKFYIGQNNQDYSLWNMHWLYHIVKNFGLISQFVNITYGINMIRFFVFFFSFSLECSEKHDFNVYVFEEILKLKYVFPDLNYLLWRVFPLHILFYFPLSLSSYDTSNYFNFLGPLKVKGATIWPFFRSTSDQCSEEKVHCLRLLLSILKVWIQGWAWNLYC